MGFMNYVDLKVTLVFDSWLSQSHRRVALLITLQLLSELFPRRKLFLAVHCLYCWKWKD